jgi:hypothetical protein
MEKNLRPNSMLTTLKLYIFPTLVTILAMMIWRDVTELRSDVKSLLAQSNIDKTRIDNLIIDVKALEQTIYNKESATDNSWFKVAHDPYFKPEEEYDIKKYIKTS